MLKKILFGTIILVQASSLLIGMDTLQQERDDVPRDNAFQRITYNGYNGEEVVSKRKEYIKTLINKRRKLTSDANELIKTYSQISRIQKRVLLLSTTPGQPTQALYKTAGKLYVKGLELYEEIGNIKNEIDNCDAEIKQEQNYIEHIIQLERRTKQRKAAQECVRIAMEMAKKLRAAQGIQKNLSI